MLWRWRDTSAHDGWMNRLALLSVTVRDAFGQNHR